MFHQLHLESCRLPYKGTNFSANHNEKPIHITSGYVVDYLTKVQISQQITTQLPLLTADVELSITLQRYKFLSKSQHRLVLQSFQRSCRLPYKGTNFSANHNYIMSVSFRKWVVDYLTKVQISQQITTVSLKILPYEWLSITLQRYKFLSKSQHNKYNSPQAQVVDYLTKVQISQQIAND